MSLQNTVDKVFSTLARVEETSYPKATLLKNFSRSVQLNGYSCGSKSVYSVLRYFKKRCTIASVERSLKTAKENTNYSDIKRVIRERGLFGREVERVQDLRKTIDRGSPVVVCFFENVHWVILYGYSGEEHLFVMNPSLNPLSMGSLSWVMKTEDFLRMWDGWGLAVGRKHWPWLASVLTDGPRGITASQIVQQELLLHQSRKNRG